MFRKFSNVSLLVTAAVLLFGQLISPAADKEKDKDQTQVLPIWDRSYALNNFIVKTYGRIPGDYTRQFEAQWADNTLGELPASSQDFLRLLREVYHGKRDAMFKDVGSVMDNCTNRQAMHLRRTFDMDRHEVIKHLLADAVNLANGKLKAGEPKIANLDTVNSGSSGDVTRDIDLTLLAGGNEAHEKLLIDAITEVATSTKYGLSIHADPGVPPTIPELEISFHRGTLEPPTFNTTKTVKAFALDYARVVKGQILNPEAYIGWGFDIEVKARQTQTFKPGVTRMQHFEVDPGSGKLVYSGETARSQKEAYSLLNEPYERAFSKGKRAMRSTCNLIQATHHVKPGQDGKGPVFDAPDKGPPKYAWRTVEDLCGAYSRELWGVDVDRMPQAQREVYVAEKVKTLTSAQREFIVGKLFEPGIKHKPANDTRKKLYESFLGLMERLPRLTDKAANGKPVGADGKPLNVEVDTRLSVEFMKFAVAAQIPQMAREMLNPPFDPAFHVLMSKEPGWYDLDTAGRNKRLMEAAPEYRKALQAEGMVNLLAAMTTVRTLNMPGFEGAGGQFGLTLTNQILQRHQWNRDVLRVLETAAKYAEAKSDLERATSEKSIEGRRRAAKTMRECLKTLEGQIGQFQGEEILAKWSEVPPQEVLGWGPEGLKARFEPRLLKLRADVNEWMAQSFGSKTYEDFRKLTTEEVVRINKRRFGRWVRSETMSFPTILDLMTQVELYHNDASLQQMGGALMLSALGRTHWAMGYLVGFMQCQTMEDYKNFAESSAIWTIPMLFPETMPLLVIWEVHNAMTRMIYYEIRDKIEAMAAEANYSGTNLDKPMPHKVLDDKYILTVFSKEKNGNVRVVNQQLLFEDRFRQWAGTDYYDRAIVDKAEARPRDNNLPEPVPARIANDSTRLPGTQIKVRNPRAELAGACDDYAKLLEAQMAYYEPTWVSKAAPDDVKTFEATATRIAGETWTIPGEIKPQVFIPEELKLRIRNRYLDIQDIIKTSVWIETNKAAQFYETQNEDLRRRVCDQMTARMTNDFIAGLELSVQSQIGQKLLAKQQIEQMAEMADLLKMAEGIVLHMQDDDTPLPEIELVAGYNLSGNRLLDGTDPIPLLCEIHTKGPLPSKLPEVELSVEYKDVVNADPSKKKIEPGDTVKHSVTVVAKMNGREVARKDVSLTVKLPGQPPAGRWKLMKSWSEKSETNDVRGEGIDAFITRGTTNIGAGSGSTDGLYIAGMAHTKIISKVKYTWTEPPGELRPETLDPKTNKPIPGEVIKLELSAEDDGSSKEFRTEKFKASKTGPEWEPAPPNQQKGLGGEISAGWSIPIKNPFASTMIRMSPGSMDIEKFSATCVTGSKPADKITGKYTPPNGTDYPAGTILLYTVQVAGKTSGGKVYYQYEWTIAK